MHNYVISCKSKKQPSITEVSGPAKKHQKNTYIMVYVIAENSFFNRWKLLNRNGLILKKERMGGSTYDGTNYGKIKTELHGIR